MIHRDNMFTPAQAKSLIALIPFLRSQALEALIDRDLQAACSRWDQDAAWPLVIVPPDGSADVVDQVVAGYTAAGWSMTFRPADQGGQILVDRPTR
jgi:hypothetical protein